MDKFDNCSHDKEQVLVAQYFSQLDPEEEQVIRQQKVTLDAEKELRRETKEEVQYRTPLDYFKEQKDRKLEHLISLDSVNMFENPNVQKNFGKARVICAREHLFIGSSLGHVLVVAKETTLVQGKRPDSARAAITAMDATKRYLLIGYEDGWFAVMDINSYQIVLQQKVLQCRILLIKKMWEGTKSSISFFLSDESGCCRIIQITRGILGYDYEMQLCLPQQMFPWVSASFIEEDTTRNWLSEGSILLLSSVSRFIAIQVYKNRDKKFNQIIDIDNPHLTSNEKCLYSFVTHGKAAFNQDDSKLVTLLAWNSHLYFIYKKEDEYHLMKPLVFSNQLIHFCYFVAESILQVVTQTQSILTCIVQKIYYYKYFSQKVYHMIIKIYNKRFTEMNNLRKQSLLQLLMNFIFEVIPIAVLYSTILIFQIFSLEAILMIARNYYILIYVISMIPEYLSQLLIALTSIQRLQEFLQKQRPSYACLITNSNVSVHIEGSFSWGQEFILKDINIKIPQGQTVLILGPNGSGKSSLLYAILGEIRPIGECKCITQRIIFATQEPWILQSSIRQNILCGQQFDQIKFQQLMKEFQLLEDLYDINRELTENGASLSGGQRKRVHLCRTAYQESDIYIFDTPQGALDQKTQSRLVEAFHKKDNKTRIIASQTLENFNFVDRVIILADGKQIYDGNYQQACLIYPSKSIKQTLEKTIVEDSGQDIVNLVEIDEVQKNQEDRQLGYVDSEVFRSLFNLYGGITILLISCLIGWTGMILRIYYQNELSEITKISDSEDSTDQERYSAYSYYLILYPICTLGSTLSTFLLGLVLIFQGIKASKLLHTQIIETLLKGSIQYFYNLNQSSSVKNRLTNDLYQFDMKTAPSISLLFTSIYQVLTNLFACVLLSSYKAYPCLLIYTYLYGFYTLKYIRIKLEMGRLQAVSRSPMISCFSETAQSIVFLRQQEPNYQNFFNLLNKNQKANINLAAIMGWYNQITCVLQILVYLAIININYFDQSLSSEQATLSVYLCVQLSDTLSVLGTSAEDFYSQMIYLERCLSLLKMVQEPIDINMEPCSIRLDEQHPLINIVNLKLHYDEKIILHDINLLINHQEKVNINYEQIAIIGRTGCGKTSLMQCITRIISPSSGILRLNGLDDDQMDLNSIRGLFSVLNQDSFVFEASIRQNIDPNHKYTDTEIIEKIKLYGLSQISLFSNINQIIDANTLSPGEKQIIQLCRTLLQNRQIVILDECTGNLDDAYSKLFDKLLTLHLNNKCVIGVTHKIEQLDIFDKVILLKSGHIVAQGNKEEVLDKYFS